MTCTHGVYLRDLMYLRQLMALHASHEMYLHATHFMYQPASHELYLHAMQYMYPGLHVPVCHAGIHRFGVSNVWGSGMMLSLLQM